MVTYQLTEISVGCFNAAFEEISKNEWSTDSYGSLQPTTWCVHKEGESAYEQVWLMEQVELYGSAKQGARWD